MLDKIEEFIDLIKITEALCEVHQYTIYRGDDPSIYIDKVQESNFDFLHLDRSGTNGLYELQKIGLFGDYVSILVTNDADMVINRMRAEMYGCK